jgi:hypothetical protein
LSMPSIRARSVPERSLRHLSAGSGMSIQTRALSSRRDINPSLRWVVIPEGYQADLRAYYAEQDGVKRDEIAGRQLHTLRQYQAPDEKKFRLADVKRLFELMKDLT